MTKIDSLFELLRSDWPDGRPPETLPSRVTSVDVKLCYNHSEDSFIGVVLSDINANPGGIRDRSKKGQVDIAKLVSEAFIANLRGDEFELAIILPSDVYDDSTGRWHSPQSWYTQDRRVIADAVKRRQAVSETTLVSDCSRLHYTSGQLSIRQDDNELSVDGYVNLDDTGVALSHALNDEINALAKGANAPTAVWNPRFDKSGKVGLLEMAAELSKETKTVSCPRFRRVEALSELDNFRAEIGDSVLKGPFGTHGNEVVSIRQEDGSIQEIRAVEERLKQEGGQKEFKIYEESTDAFVFNDRGWESGYGLAEEAITGTFHRDGDEIETLEFKTESGPHPIDFVPLAICRNDQSPEIPSTMVRISNSTNLNANLQAGSMTLETLKTAFKNGVTVEVEAGEYRRINIQRLAEQIAQRPVSFEELQNPLLEAGRLALLVRNRTALQIEQAL